MTNSCSDFQCWLKNIDDISVEKLLTSFNGNVDIRDFTQLFKKIIMAVVILWNYIFDIILIQTNSEKVEL